MPSCNTYHLTWVSLTLGMGYLFTAAPAKTAAAPYLGWAVSPYRHRSWPSTWDSSSRSSCACSATAPRVAPPGHQPCPRFWQRLNIFFLTSFFLSSVLNFFFSLIFNRKISLTCFFLSAFSSVMPLGYWFFHHSILGAAIYSEPNSCVLGECVSEWMIVILRQDEKLPRKKETCLWSLIYLSDWIISTEGKGPLGRQEWTESHCKWLTFLLIPCWVLCYVLVLKL